MCGIFAYLGPKSNAPEIVVNGLKKLEYRGYDSWGVAWKKDHTLEIFKQIGKIGDFDAKTLSQDTNAPKKRNRQKSSEQFNNLTIQPFKNSSLAIGHTRWATHGGVTQANAHPHFTEDKTIAVIHNGIIENYQKLRDELKTRGHTFTSETDTEIIAHLIEEKIDLGFEIAFKKALEKLHGRYAIIAISARDHKIIAARRGSPLIVGVNDQTHEYFIASDIPAFLEYTRNVQYLDDNQMVIINNGTTFFDLETSKPIKKRVIQINWKIEMAEKGDYPHFMIKEIMEQKDSLNRAINQDEKLIMKVAKEINKAYGTYLIGCGTAGKVCHTASYLFSRVAKKHVNFAFGSEFPSHQEFLTDKTLLIAVSQSGETADIMEAIEVAKKKGVKVVAIVNVETSTMARQADIVIPVKAGPEKAVASTKVTTSQIAILTLLAYACAGKLDEGQRLLINTASQINDMLNPRYEEHIRRIAEKIKGVESMYVIGKSVNYPMALEAAIKLQEVSYIHAEGFAAGELKHGPIALISQGTPCIAIVANDETKAETLSNAMEIKARGGYIIGVSPQNSEIFDDWIRVPDSGNASPIISIIPIQILAYQLAVLRQNNPDMPRNLAKSVTVK